MLMAGFANKAFEPENTSDELSAIKYIIKEGICKPLFSIFCDKKITKKRAAVRLAGWFLSYYSIIPIQAGRGWGTDPLR